jgi:hypothetical protein
MTMDRETLENLVSSHVPKCDDDVVQTISDICLECGVKKEEDLQFVTEGDLVPRVTRVEARSFLANIQKNAHGMI